MRTKITRGGQISIPAPIRRRWGTDRVEVEDQGDALLVRPLPADPIAAARGLVRLPRGLNADRLRRLARAEEAEAETRH